MIKVIIHLEAASQDRVEEWLWIKQALSVTLPAPHEQARYLEALFHSVDEDAFERELQGLEVTIGTVHYEEVKEQAWQESWRNHFKPLQVGTFRLIGEWEQEAEHRRTVRIYPGMAFGTGQHPTTQLIIEQLEGMDLEGKKVLDAGCGTGLLSIVAERLGATEVFGFDIDPDSKENMERHLAINRTKHSQLRIGQLEEFQLGRYDVVLANITINVLEELWPKLRDHLVKGGSIISSGILQEQQEQARAALEQAGYQVKEVCARSEWVMIKASGP